MNMKTDHPGLEAITALGWETLETQRAKSKAIQMYEVLSGLPPNSLVNLLAARKSIILQNMISGLPLPPCEYLYLALKFFISWG